MSSINPHFTLKYSQPEGYRFSHDSVFLARRVFERLRSENLGQYRVLDLCAGCGVVGLDFLFHLENEGLPTPRVMDFLEVQSEAYSGHFAANAATLGTHSAQFIAGNYSDFGHSQTVEPYDLILCNPPYFRVGQGALSPSPFKNRCRFFIDAAFDDLFRAIGRVLRGRAYVLLRGLEDHGVDVEAEVRTLLPTHKIVRLESIRGTGLIEITAPRR